jgi:HrpA-like RNA helicase
MCCRLAPVDLFCCSVVSLLQIGAAAVNAKGRVEPTRTGSFLAAVPLSLESSLLLARGSQQGMMFEAAVLAALMNSTPYPIRQPFGAEAMKYVSKYYWGGGTGDGQAGNAWAAASRGPEAVRMWRPNNAQLQRHGEHMEQHLQRQSGGTDSLDSCYNEMTADADDVTWHFPADCNNLSINSSGGCWDNNAHSLDVCSSSSNRTMTRSMQLLANLAAYEAWQQQWCDRERLKRFVAADDPLHEADTAAAAANDLDEPTALQDLSGSSTAQADWCDAHHLLLSGLRHVADTVAVIFTVIHKFRPSFLQFARGAPEYYTKQVSWPCQAWPLGATGCGVTGHWVRCDWPLGAV